MKPDKEQFSNEDPIEKKSDQEIFGSDEIVDALRNILSDLSTEKSDGVEKPPLESFMMDGDSPVERQQKSIDPVIDPSLSSLLSSDQINEESAISEDGPLAKAFGALADENEENKIPEISDSDFWEGNVLGWPDKDELAGKQSVLPSKNSSMEFVDDKTPLGLGDPDPESDSELNKINLSDDLSSDEDRKNTSLGFDESAISFDSRFAPELPDPRFANPNEAGENSLKRDEPSVPSEGDSSMDYFLPEPADPEIESLEKMFPKGPVQDMAELSELPNEKTKEIFTAPGEEKKPNNIASPMVKESILPDGPDSKISPEEEEDIPVSIPGTIEEKADNPPKSEDNQEDHFNAIELKPAHVLQIACIYPEGEEDRAENFVTKLREAGAKNKKVIDIQPVFVQGWNSETLDIQSWEKSAKLSGSTFMFILISKEDKAVNKAISEDAKSGIWSGRVVQLERTVSRSLYADLMHQLGTMI